MFNFREMKKGEEEGKVPYGTIALAAINNCPQRKHLSRCIHFQGDELCSHPR